MVVTMDFRTEMSGVDCHKHFLCGNSWLKWYYLSFLYKKLKFLYKRVVIPCTQSYQEGGDPPGDPFHRVVYDLIYFMTIWVIYSTQTCLILTFVAPFVAFVYWPSLILYIGDYTYCYCFLKFLYQYLHNYLMF